MMLRLTGACWAQRALQVPLGLQAQRGPQAPPDDGADDDEDDAADVGDDDYCGGYADDDADVGGGV